MIASKSMLQQGTSIIVTKILVIFGMDNHSIDAFDIVSNASTNLGCHEDEIVPFENPKSDYQIDTLAGDSVESSRC
jgi:hypothetical protein